MDAITQGLLGGVAAQVFQRKKPASAYVTWAGVLGGMAPDLDILIRSSSDPLMAIEYHRHFTHSLAFVPFGGLISGFLIWLMFRRRPSLRSILFGATVGYATHGLLDAFTSYGTQLYWPFSHTRVAWDMISIIDPIFTLGFLLIGFIVSLKRKGAGAARVALLLASLYMGLGGWQHHRGMEMQRSLAAERGHPIERGRVTPTLGNLLVWRSTYKSGGKIYVDAFRLGLGGETAQWSGGSREAFATEELLASLPPDSTLARDLKLYRWFSDDYLAVFEGEGRTLGDMRYSFSPEGAEPIWGISFHPQNPHQHARRVRFPGARREAFSTLWKMLFGEASASDDSIEP